MFEPIDSSKYFNTLEEWVEQGIKEFFYLMSIYEPVEFRGGNTRDAQIGALRECAKVFGREEKPTPPKVQTLQTWYQYSLMEFIATTFIDVDKRLLPEGVNDPQLYIENAIVSILQSHMGSTDLDF